MVGYGTVFVRSIQITITLDECKNKGDERMLPSLARLCITNNDEVATTGVPPPPPDYHRDWTPYQLELFEKYEKGTLTSAEWDEFMILRLEAFERRKQFKDDVKRMFDRNEEEMSDYPVDLADYMKTTPIFVKGVRDAYARASADAAAYDDLLRGLKARKVAKASAGFMKASRDLLDQLPRELIFNVLKSAQQTWSICNLIQLLCKALGPRRCDADFWNAVGVELVQIPTPPVSVSENSRGWVREWCKQLNLNPWDIYSGFRNVPELLPAALSEAHMTWRLERTERFLCCYEFGLRDVHLAMIKRARDEIPREVFLDSEQSEQVKGYTEQVLNWVFNTPFLLAAVRNDGRYLQYASLTDRNNKDVVRMACLSHEGAFEHASKSLRKDEAFVKELISSRPNVLLLVARAAATNVAIVGQDNEDQKTEADESRRINIKHWSPLMRGLVFATQQFRLYARANAELWDGWTPVSTRSWADTWNNLNVSRIYYGAKQVAMVMTKGSRHNRDFDEPLYPHEDEDEDEEDIPVDEFLINIGEDGSMGDLLVTIRGDSDEATQIALFENHMGASKQHFARYFV